MMQVRERVGVGVIASCATAAVLALAAFGCSGSDAKGTNVLSNGGCDPAVDAACHAAGASCSGSGDCASGSCVAGQCAAEQTGCEGGGCGPSMGGGGSTSFEDTFFVDDLDTSRGGAPDQKDPSCVDLDVDFTRITPTVVLLLDRSGSMSQPFDGGKARWATLVSTLTDPQGSLIKKLDSSVRFGMSLYTSNGGFGTGTTPRACPVLKNVDIALNNFSAMSAVLAVPANGPSGDTPTAESMAVISKQLQDFKGDGPKSIILATDGDPDTCEDPNANNSDLSKAKSVQAVQDAFVAGITTHIISVGDEVTASHLKALAVAGQGGDTKAEAYTALDTSALVDAFDSIIGAVRTCDFKLKGTVQPKDAARGTVLLDGHELAYGDANGWEMPDPQTVTLLGQACSAVQADATGISMRFPCDAISLGPR